MATSINVRLDDELEKKLKSTMERIKLKAPRGAEVNNSTIVRGAIKEFIEKTELENRGDRNIIFKLSNITSKSEAENLYTMIEKYMNMLNQEEDSKSSQIFKGLLIGALIEIK